jgi:hypothetical protein
MATCETDATNDNPKLDPYNWSEKLKLGDKEFEVQRIGGAVLVNRFDITEFIDDPRRFGRLTEARRKRISSAHKQLDVDELEWAGLLKAVNDLVVAHAVRVKRATSAKAGKKSPWECPFILYDEGQFGPVIVPLCGEIATYLISKFNLMAISDEIRVEGLDLWICTGNEYRQLPKNDKFLIKEMQTVMDEYGLSSYVEVDWIDRHEILRQAKVKRIVQPTRGILPVANGILDINNMKLLADDEGKISLVRSGVVYDPDAKCPEFDKFLIDIFNGDEVKIEALLSWIGATIAGMHPQIIIMFKSRGRSGKGVFMEIISNLLGNMMTMMSPNKLHDRFSNWGFFHRIMVYLEEFDCKDATIKAMKELSGGSPSVSFETKGVQAIMQALVQCAIIINTNNPPPFERGSAWEERFKMLDFPNSYVDSPKEPWEKKIDYGLKDRLLKELPGILNKFLVYAKYALDLPEQMFKQDIKYKDFAESLDRSTESLDYFINECCELAPMEMDFYRNMKPQYNGYKVTDTTFMKRYKEFCSRPDINTRVPPKKEVKDALKRDHHVLVHDHNLIGVRLKKQGPSPTSSASLASFNATAAGS